MIDVVGIITAAAPIVTGLASLIINLIVYLKTKAVHQAVTQQNNSSSNASIQSNNP